MVWLVAAMNRCWTLEKGAGKKSRNKSWWLRRKEERAVRLLPGWDDELHLQGGRKAKGAVDVPQEPTRRGELMADRAH